ncbi:hypothetical protein CEY12_20440 [Chryseobacterium sp. T16E-39]|uniref:hypothetical protein n=1 Tax=Chryseobacterium sp. T16E-39 TaxID=2015076 RepID=UPI000B5B4508|nr:hypothetical protein [Chryseobacterium sp. T16E-39]ASK32308.1 hypothetical protein CEY12_20440 [Chryseobacterium sp. T16E-39]
MKLFLLVLSLFVFTSCSSNSDDTPTAPGTKSTKYYVHKSLTKKNGIVTSTTLHDGTCTAKSYYQIDQLIDTTPVTFVSYSTCENYQIQKGSYNSAQASMILDFVIYRASINGNELTVSKITTNMWDTYEETTIAKAN